MREEEEVATDPVFLGMTRPQTFLGVPWEAIGIYATLTVCAQVATEDLRSWIIFPLCHAVAYLLFRRDPHIFSVLVVRARSAKPIPNRAFWGARSYRP